MNFTVYNKTTGKILRTGSCPDDQFHLQANEDEIIEGNYPDNLFYWDEEFKPIPPKPDGFYNFDYTSKSWVRNTAQAISVNRLRRNAFLAETDWTQLNDVALSSETKALWTTYRQELRDMTEDDFLNENFPVVPA